MEIKIQAKFSIGDRVFFMKDNSVHTDSVDKIIVRTKISKNTGFGEDGKIKQECEIEYRLKTNIKDTYYQDSNHFTNKLFATKEELLKSL